jgi:hypothetical protein
MPNGRKVTNDNGVYIEETYENLHLLHDLDLIARGMLVMLASCTRTQTKKNQGGVLMSNVAVAKIDGRYIFACNGIPDQLDITRSTQLNLQDVPTRTEVRWREGVDDPGSDKIDVVNKEPLTSGGRPLVSVVNEKPDGTFVKQYLEVIHYRVVPREKIRPFLNNMLAGANNPMPAATQVTLLGPTEAFDAHAEMRILKFCRDNGLPLQFIGVCKPCCEHCANALDAQRIGYSRWAAAAQQHTGWTNSEEIKDTTTRDL